MRNLEFKARLVDEKEAIRRARELGAEIWGDLRQADTYFLVPNGRFKLRETAGYDAELIFYERDEAAANRPSDYSRGGVRQAPELRETLGRALGVLATVRKRRTLLLAGTIRIHLDDVERLGRFLEIEVPVGDGADARTRRSVRLLTLSPDSATLSTTASGSPIST